ncbi:MAG: hypothetical protein J7L63_00410 [Thermoplasmata archaeon]|nr:hypothetical protein [Thermoplasmata archaeon]
MNELELQDALKDLLEEIPYMDPLDRDRLGLLDGFDDIESVRTFEEAGVLTRNAGLVCRLGDGSEFQITIVQSR